MKPPVRAVKTPENTAWKKRITNWTLRTLEEWRVLRHRQDELPGYEKQQRPKYGYDHNEFPSGISLLTLASFHPFLLSQRATGHPKKETDRPRETLLPHLQSLFKLGWIIAQS